MPEKLKPCPCGRVPEELDIDQSITSRRYTAEPSCCHGWMVEFFSPTEHYDELSKLATAAWNAAPRGESND